MIRLIYCEMLGVECTWGYIHAVKFTQSSSIADKRTGKRERERDRDRERETVNYSGMIAISYAYLTEF